MARDLFDFRPRSVPLPGHMPVLLRMFLRELGAKQRSANTIAAYRRDLGQFLAFLQARGLTQIQEVDAATVEGFLMVLMGERGNSARTVARKLETVRSLYRFAARRRLVPEKGNAANLAEAPKWHADPPPAPSTNAIMQLIAAIPGDTPIGVRDRAMFRLMFDGAMRISALCTLDLYDENQPPRHCIYPNGRVVYLNKGGRTRETVVDDATLRYIDRWLEVRMRFANSGTGNALFLTGQGGRMSRQTLHARIKEYGAAAGMPGIHCHLLRHRRARDVIDEAGLASASYLLGHAQQSTTASMYNEGSAALLRARIRGSCRLPESTE